MGCPCDPVPAAELDYGEGSEGEGGSDGGSDDDKEGAPGGRGDWSGCCCARRQPCAAAAVLQSTRARLEPRLCLCTALQVLAT